LELNGYSVRRGGDIHEALEKFSSFSPGIVLIDASLPAKSWLELIKCIRDYEVEKDSDYRCVILVTTTRYSNEIYQKAIKFGASDVVGKPVEHKVLLQSIVKYATQY
ncbi:MAG TPA: response regulator, partial [Turneriella sp.]|nr:response regulator [Turneriella sp.]